MLSMKGPFFAKVNPEASHTSNQKYWDKKQWYREKCQQELAFDLYFQYFAVHVDSNSSVGPNLSNFNKLLLGLQNQGKETKRDAEILRACYRRECKSALCEV